MYIYIYREREIDIHQITREELQVYDQIWIYTQNDKVAEIVAGMELQLYYHTISIIQKPYCLVDIQLAILSPRIKCPKFGVPDPTDSGTTNLRYWVLGISGVN